MELRKLILLIYLVSIMFFVSSQPPFQTNPLDTGLQIEVPVLEYHLQDRDFTFHIHVHNSTGAIISNEGGLICFLHVYQPDGNHTIKDVMIPDPEQPFDMIYYANGGNFSTLGQYSVYFSCQYAGEYGWVDYSFEVTPDGNNGNLGFNFLILLLSFGVIALGFYMSDSPLVILGSLGLYFVGFYILFYGLNGVRDPVYTWALGVITLCVAIYVSIRGSMELLN